jgi:hypothetical protein
MKNSRKFRKYRSSPSDKSEFYDYAGITIPIRVQKGLKDATMLQSVSLLMSKILLGVIYITNSTFTLGL